MSSLCWIPLWRALSVYLGWSLDDQVPRADPFTASLTCHNKYADPSNFGVFFLARSIGHTSACVMFQGFSQGYKALQGYRWSVWKFTNPPLGVGRSEYLCRRGQNSARFTSCSFPCSRANWPLDWAYSSVFCRPVQERCGRLPRRVRDSIITNHALVYNHEVWNLCATLRQCRGPSEACALLGTTRQPESASAEPR